MIHPTHHKLLDAVAGQPILPAVGNDFDALNGIRALRASAQKMIMPLDQSGQLWPISRPSNNAAR